MVRDPDENPRDYQASVVLLVVGSMLYLVPLTFGIEVGSQRHLSGAVTFFTSNTNFDLAIASFYVALTLVVVTAGYIFGYVVLRSAPRGGATPVSGATAPGTPQVGHVGD
jgi:hypothetical protein